jgi:hypothetical protein
MKQVSLVSFLALINSAFGGDIPITLTYDFFNERTVACDDVRRGYQTLECCGSKDKCIDTTQYADKCCEDESMMTISKACTEGSEPFDVINIVETRGFYTRELREERKKYTWSLDSLKKIDPSIHVSTGPTDVKQKDFDMSSLVYGDGSYVHAHTTWGMKMHTLASRITEIEETMTYTKDMPHMYNGMTYAEVKMDVTGGKLQGMDEIFSGNLEPQNFKNTIMSQVNDTVYPIPRPSEDAIAFQWFDFHRPTSAYSFHKKPNGKWTIGWQTSSADGLSLARPSIEVLDVWHLADQEVENCPICETLTFTPKSGSSVTILKIAMESLVITPGGLGGSNNATNNVASDDGVFNKYAVVGPFVDRNWDFPTFCCESLRISSNSEFPGSRYQYMILEAMKQPDGSMMHNVMVYKGATVGVEAVPSGFTGEYSILRDDANKPILYWPVYDVGMRGLRMTLGMDSEVILQVSETGVAVGEDQLISLTMHYPTGVMINTNDFMHGDECFKNRNEFVEYLHMVYAEGAVVPQPLAFPPSPPPPPFFPSASLDQMVAENPCQCVQPQIINEDGTSLCQVYDTDGNLRIINRCGCEDFTGSGAICYVISATCTDEIIAENNLVGTVAESTWQPGVLYTQDSFCFGIQPPSPPQPPAAPPPPPFPCANDDQHFFISGYVGDYSSENALVYATPDPSFTKYSDVYNAADAVFVWGPGVNQEAREDIVLSYCGDLTSKAFFLTDNYGDGWHNGWSSASLTIKHPSHLDSAWNRDGVQLGFYVHGTSAGLLDEPVYVGDTINDAVFCEYQKNCPDGGNNAEGQFLQVSFGPAP